MIYENPFSPRIPLIPTRNEIADAMHHYEKTFERNFAVTYKTTIFRCYLRDIHYSSISTSA